MSNNLILDITHFPKELQLLLMLLRTEGLQQRDLPSSLLQDIDWDDFLKLARHHRVYPTIYSQLKQLQDQRFPLQVVQSLQQQCQMNTFRMLPLSAELVRIFQVFHSYNIRAMLLKGPTLAQELYGDISFRPSKDLDILISVDDVDQIHQILLEEGYVLEEGVSTVFEDWKWRWHHMEYMHMGKRIQIEIHWRLSPGPAKEPSFEELWERKRAVSLTNSPVYSLGDTDLFLFLVSHGARHGWFRLRWLADIDRLLQKNLNWKQLLAIVRKHEASHMAGQALILISQLLHTPLPNELQKLTQRSFARNLAQKALYYIRQIINPHDETVSGPDRYHKRYLYFMKTNRQKLLHAMNFLYPHITDVETLRLPKRLYWLYFPLRPVLWIWRRLGRNSSLQEQRK